MSNSNFEGHPEGDWDDRGEISWNEFDWQQFLRRQQREVARFISLYDEYNREPEHLDLIARHMGWDADDWSVTDFDPEDDEDADSDREFSVDDEDASDLDPYTIHRHPVYVVSSGLYAQIRYAWEVIMTHRESAIDSSDSWNFANSLAEGERNVLMGLQSLDMGDYLLAVIHMKMSLRSINSSLAVLQHAAGKTPELSTFFERLQARLFDLREVALRVINDCREEDRRGFKESD